MREQNAATSPPTAELESSERVKRGRAGRRRTRRKTGQPRRTVVKGMVELIGDFPAEKFGSANGVKHSGAVLRTETERLVVHLGPVRFFQEHDFPVRAGDYLEISGSKMLTEDRTLVLLASEIKTKEKKLQLRNSHGLPLW